MRPHLIRTAVILLLSLAGSSQKAASGEVLQLATSPDSGMANHDVADTAINSQDTVNPAKPTPNVSASNKVLTFRRSARFYSWLSSCYTQDREENWYQIDARLC